MTIRIGFLFKNKKNCHQVCSIAMSFSHSYLECKTVSSPAQEPKTNLFFTLKFLCSRVSKESVVLERVSGQEGWVTVGGTKFEGIGIDWLFLQNKYSLCLHAKKTTTTKKAWSYTLKLQSHIFVFTKENYVKLHIQTCKSTSTGALFIINKIWKQPMCSSSNKD